jgi:hypothetical protein
MLGWLEGVCSESWSEGLVCKERVGDLIFVLSTSTDYSV